MQNNRFCNVLKDRMLDNVYAFKISLHFYSSFSVYKASCESKLHNYLTNTKRAEFLARSSAQILSEANRFNR